MATDDTGHGHFVVVGAQRCGTTYLRTLLDEHPEHRDGRRACRSPAREPKVFLSDEVVARGHRSYDAAWFPAAPPGALLGEKSTSYLEVPATIGRIRAVLGDVRVLVQLRDPIARAVSNWQLSTAHGLETRPLEQALVETLEGPREWDPATTSVSPYAYLERGRYAEQLAPWRDAFGDRLRVQLLEDLLADPTAIRQIYAWLGVHPEFSPPSLGEQVNESSVEAPLLGSEVTARLRGYYSGSDRELESQLGRPVPWSR